MLSVCQYDASIHPVDGVMCVGWITDTLFSLCHLSQQVNSGTFAWKETKDSPLQQQQRPLTAFDPGQPG